MRHTHSAVLAIALVVQLFLPMNLGLALARQETTNEQGQTGVDLLHKCNDAIRLSDGVSKFGNKEDLSAMRCLEYLAGFIDGYAFTESSYRGRLQSPLICLPGGGVSAEQMIRIVAKWLTDHPERLHERQGVLVMLAFEQAFPCK